MNIKLLLLIMLASLSVLIGVIILVVLFTNNTIHGSSTQSKQNIEKTTPSERNNAPSKPKCGGTYCLGNHKVFERTIWGGKDPSNIDPIESPVPVVVIKHSGGGTCSSFETCGGKVQSLDSYSISYGLPQIKYNFLIGGDGNIYVGRGWDVQPDQIRNTIDIVFIGSYSFDVLTDSMIEAAQLLLKDGTELNKLTEDYTLIAHNQTTGTESPGSNVYKEIIKWPHFTSRYMHVFKHRLNRIEPRAAQ